MKKAISLILALVMALGCVQLSAFATGETPTGYSGASLPAGPTDMNSETINVNAANAQYVLDGAYGNINGKTINFTQNVTEVLDLARPTKYQGSGTTYLAYHGGHYDEGDPRAWSEDYLATITEGNNKYYRTVSNVTFTANSGVTLAGFSFSNAHVTGSGHDYVRDTDVTDNNNGYHKYSTLKNITFSGLTVTGTASAAPFYCIGSGNYGAVSGITFTGCTISASSSETNMGAVHFNNNGTLKYGSISFSNSIITSQNGIGIYINGVGEGTITLTNNYIVGGNNNAIQITKKIVNENEGSVTVTGNYLKSDKYTVNLNNFTSSQITFTGNAVVAGSQGHLGYFSGVADGNFWAETGAAPDATTGVMPEALTGYYPRVNSAKGDLVTPSSYYTHAVVNRDGDTKVALSNLVTPSAEPAPVTYVAQIGSTGYATLAAAVEAAQSGDTITLLADDDTSLTDGLELKIDKALTITGAVDGNGEPLYTIYGKNTVTGYNDIFITGSGNVKIENVKIKQFGNNAATDAGHAPVYVSTSYTGKVTLNNVYISDFNRGGIFLYGGDFKVNDCYIDCANSTSGAFTKGIEIKGSANGTISGTVICNMERSSKTYSTAGIEIYGSGEITVDDCTIISDVDPHKAVKETYGIVVSHVGDFDASGGTLTINNCIFDVTNGSISVSDDATYGPVNPYTITVVGEDTYFSNYIGMFSPGSSVTIEDGEFNEDVYIDAGTINIEGGEFNSFAPYTGTDGSIVITGGTFDANPSTYVAPGYTATDNGDNTWTVVPYVAQIGEDEGAEKYLTLEAAFNAAQDNQTIKLLTNVALTDRLFVNAGATATYDSSNKRYATTSENKAITLDLNDHNITSTSNIALAGGSLNITGSGTISTSASGVAPVEIRYSGDLTAKRTLTIGSGVTLSGTCYGLNIFGSNTNVKNSIDVTVNGTVNGMLFVLGNLKNTANEINVVVNGKISAPAATSGSPNPGIALNGYADVTVNNSASVTGDSGIEVRAGRLTVNGGTITGTASPTSVNANGSGTTSAGAGVAVAQHTTKLPITVTIDGARLKGYTGLAISNPEKNTGSEEISVRMTNTNVVLNNGGTKEVSFIADANGVGAETRYGVTWDANDAISKIGTPAGYKVKTDETTYMIEPIGEDAALASIGTKTYSTLADAVVAAQNGDTITLLNKNVLGATVEFSGKTLTLDLNGNNIEATDLRALHIKSGSVSIIGSGTIKTTHVEDSNFSSSSSVIRVGDNNTNAAAASLTIGPRVTVSSNYCYGVTVFGKNVANNAGYGQTLVVNGTVSVTGTASAISGNGNKDNSAVSTTINDGATVTATADCAIYHPQAGKLAINGGTISGPTAIEIKAGQANVATSEVIVTGTPKITATGAKKHAANGNGPSTCGYALAAVENEGYKGGIAISIAKGVFTGGEVAILRDSESTSQPTISITGGTFINDVNEYCASGYAAAVLTDQTISSGEQSGWYKVGVVETTKATADLVGITDSSTAEQVATVIENLVKSDTESVSFNVQTSIKDEEADKTLDTTTYSTVQLKKTTVEAETVVTAGELEGEKRAIAAVTLDQIKPGKLQEVLENAVASAGAKSSQVHTVDVAIVKDSEAGTMTMEGNMVTKQSFEIHAEATAYVTTTNGQASTETTEAVGSYILPNSALKEGAQWSFNLPVHPDLVRVWNTGTNGVQYTTQLNHIETNETTGEETTTSKRLTVYANATGGYYTTIDNNSTYSTFELVKDELGGDDPTVTPMGRASYGATLSLEDSVYINFYMTDVKDPNGNTADEAELAKFKVVYSYNGVVTETKINNANSNHFVVATCAAKQLADNVSIMVYYNTQLIKNINYSARTYCENKIKNSNDAKLKSLCYALLEYGAYAQTRFNYNTGDLANKTYNIDAVPATVIDSEYNIAQGTGINSAVLSTGATLSLESATQINFYVTPASGYTASDITISVKDANGNNVDSALWASQMLGDGRVWVKITGIAAKNLNAAYKLVLGGGNGTRTVTYSAMSYAYRMRNSADESSICKALNNYHLAAYAYFNH